MADETENIHHLRMKLLELEKLGAFNPESFRDMQQMVLQIHSETERRRQSCVQQAATLKQQAAAMDSHASAYGTVTSILSAVINGYINIQRKQIAEQESRKAIEEGTAPKMSASGEVYDLPEQEPSEDEKPKRKRSKK